MYGKMQCQPRDLNVIKRHELRNKIYLIRTAYVILNDSFAGTQNKFGVSKLPSHVGDVNKIGIPQQTHEGIAEVENNIIPPKQRKILMI